jgi:hypothetical protein
LRYLRSVNVCSGYGRLMNCRSTRLIWPSYENNKYNLRLGLTR